MKKIVPFLFFISVFSCSISLFSQSKETYFSDAKNNSSENTSIIINSSNFNNPLTSISQISNTTNTLNSVVLTQVGLYNVSDISQSQKTTQKVTQFGNNNYYSFSDYYNNTAVNLNILQHGNANSLQIYGSNSLIDGMKIVQKSNFKNIVIKNYK